MRWLIGVLLAAAGLVAGAGCAAAPAGTASPAVAHLSVEQPWVRTTTGATDTTMTAAFMTIVNPTDHDVSLVSADFADASMVQLHEMVTRNGKKVMQQVSGGIVIPAGGHTHLVPSGYHVMLMGLKKALTVGETEPLTLHFSDGSTLDVSAPVKEFVEEEDHYDPPMSSMSAMPSASPTAG